MRINFVQYCPFPPGPLLVGSSAIEKVSCYKLLGVQLSDNLRCNEHVTHIVKKGSKRLTDRQLILVDCNIIRSVFRVCEPRLGWPHAILK